MSKRSRVERFDKHGRPLAYHIWRGDELLYIAFNRYELESAYDRIFSQNIQRNELAEFFQYSEQLEELLGEDNQ